MIRGETDAMDYGTHDLDPKLKFDVDHENRVVVVGTPEGLAEMTDQQILALLRRVSELRASYQDAGYVVTHSATEHPKWRTETAASCSCLSRCLPDETTPPPESSGGGLFDGRGRPVGFAPAPALHTPPGATAPALVLPGGRVAGGVHRDRGDAVGLTVRGVAAAVHVDGGDGGGDPLFQPGDVEARLLRGLVLLVLHEDLLNYVLWEQTRGIRPTHSAQSVDGKHPDTSFIPERLVTAERFLRIRPSGEYARSPGAVACRRAVIHPRGRVRKKEAPTRHRGAG